MKKELFHFYFLAEPNSSRVRYVGITTELPSQRLERHLRGKGGTRRKRRWLKRVGCPDLITISRRHVTKTEAIRLEKIWIQLLNDMGLVLTNGRQRVPRRRRRRR